MYDKKHTALATVYAEWLVCHSKLVSNDDLSDEEGTAICERLDELYHQATRLPASSALYTIGWKAQMLEHEMRAGAPTDNRDFLMLASIRADLET